MRKRATFSITNGGGTAQMISYLLNWMQDNHDVLVFAAANNVAAQQIKRVNIFKTGTSYIV